MATQRGGAVRRIVEHKSETDHYHADACIVWCFDNRFSALLEEFKRAHNFAHTDLVKVAGGAKGLSSPGKPYERKYVLDQIAKSLTLHHSKKIVLMVHSGCGDYGRKFDERINEEKFYFGKLNKAETVLKEFLKTTRREAQIFKYFADFDGLVELH